MADDGDRAKGKNTLGFMMGYDKNAGGGYAKSQQADAQKIEAAVIPDAMVHRDSHSEMEKAEGDK